MLAALLSMAQILRFMLAVLLFMAQTLLFLFMADALRFAASVVHMQACHFPFGLFVSGSELGDGGPRHREEDRAGAGRRLRSASVCGVSAAIYGVRAAIYGEKSAVYGV